MGCFEPAWSLVYIVLRELFSLASFQLIHRSNTREAEDEIRNNSRALINAIELPCDYTSPPSAFPKPTQEVRLTTDEFQGSANNIKDPFVSGSIKSFPSSMNHRNDDKARPGGAKQRAAIRWSSPRRTELCFWNHVNHLDWADSLPGLPPPPSPSATLLSSSLSLPTSNWSVAVCSALYGDAM